LAKLPTTKRKFDIRLPPSVEGFEICCSIQTGVAVILACSLALWAARRYRLFLYVLLGYTLFLGPCYLVTGKLTGVLYGAFFYSSFRRMGDVAGGLTMFGIYFEGYFAGLLLLTLNYLIKRFGKTWALRLGVRGGVTPFLEQLSPAR
jgi:hypothetical protein